MALIDHGISINNKFKALDLETNYLKVTSATHTIKEELIKCSDKVLIYLQQLTKSFQNFKNYLTNQAEDNKENSIQFGSQNSFCFDKLNPIFMANAASLTVFKKQIAETIDSFNEFLKVWCPKNSFDACLDLGSLQESSSNVRSPAACIDGSELKSPTLEFTKITERWKSRTAFKSRTGYTIKVNECNTSPAHHLSRIAGKEKLMFFNNFGDESPGRYFEDISPIGCMIAAETFSNNFNNLAIPIRKISEFNCETENTDENQMKSTLQVHPEQTMGTINKTDFRQRSTRTVAKSERDMSTEFSIEIEEVKAEVRNTHLDENGHELLLYGLINDDN